MQLKGKYYCQKCEHDFKFNVKDEEALVTLIENHEKSIECINISNMLGTEDIFL